MNGADNLKYLKELYQDALGLYEDEKKAKKAQTPNPKNERTSPIHAAESIRSTHTVSLILHTISTRFAELQYSRRCLSHQAALIVEVLRLPLPSR